MRYLSFLLISFISMSSYGASQHSFFQFVKQLRLDALEQNVSQATIEQLLGSVKQFRRAVHHDKRSKKTAQSLEVYLPNTVPLWKIKKARQLFIEHRQLLNDISAKYGVQPRFILAIWGVETGFSKKLSSYPAMSVLVSLAFSEPQNQEFRSQIFAALTALDKDASHQADFRSDWAGKLGMLNFSVLNYLTSGQDFDQDAFADIWQSNADAFASVAKFLADKGWNKEQTWGRQVKLPTKFDSKYLGFAQAKTLTQWQQLGVRRFNGKSLPRAKIKAALIAPDGVNGRIYLAYGNYKVLLDWQNSQYFVSAVGFLADRIKYPPTE